jgi:hypothetical protein
LVLMTQPVVGHGQEEEVEAVELTRAGLVAHRRPRQRQRRGLRRLPSGDDLPGFEWVQPDPALGGSRQRPPVRPHTSTGPVGTPMTTATPTGGLSTAPHGDDLRRLQWLRPDPGLGHYDHRLPL